MGYPEPVLKLSDISLIRKNHTELENLSLEFRPGMIHAILGKYGSGKSSLVSLLRGSTKPTSGSLIIEGRVYSSLRIRDAMKMKIAVLQHFDQFVDNLRVKEFLYDGHYGSNAAIVSGRKMNEYYRHLQETYGIPDYGDLPLSRIPVSDKFFLNIIKHIDTKPRVIVLDEILDKLNSSQLSKTIRLIKEQAVQGAAVILITTNIDEVYDVAEDVSILKNGKLIYNDDIRKVEKINLIKLAYVEISKSDRDAVSDQTFYQLLKYNEAILYELPINLLIIDREMTVKIANKSARSFFGIDSHAMLDTPLEQLFVDNVPIYQAVADAFGRQEATILHNMQLELDDKQYRANIKTNPIFDGPDFIGFILAIEDVTEQEVTREKLFMTENLASVGLLSAGVAHEINNPLEIIMNSVDYLSYHIEEDALNRKIGSIKNEVQSISKIISNLVGITHKKAFKTEKFSLNDLIRNLIDLLNQSAVERGIDIDFDEQSEDYFIEADITEIKQVVLNLVKNSFEAIGSKGRIRIRLERLDEETVAIEFEDDGPGIDENQIKNIFIPFYSSKITEDHNQGLGLYISYRIVRKYNGNISFTNLSQGCRFTVTLPLL